MSKNKHKLLKKNKFRIYRKIVIWLFFFISIIYGFFFWMNHDSLKISNLEIIGNKFVDSSVVENIYNEEVSGKYFFVISKNNFFFIPEEKIKDRIEKILSVDSVILSKEGFNKLKIEISEYKPVATYCVEDSCYFVNDKGVLFLKTPEFYVEDLIEIEGALSVETDLLGQNYSDPETFKNILETINLLSAEDIKIAKVRTDDFETYHLETLAGTDIMIEKEDNPEEVIDNLKAALVQESIHDIQFDNIEYFDLRFEDKVFYKLK